LNYGHAANALNTTETNALSGVHAAEPGLTNGVCYWRVDNVATGDFGTSARSAGPVWSFEVTERPVFSVASTNVSAYLNVPVEFSVEAESVTNVAYSAKGLPSGLKIDAAAGVVSGAPKRTGTFAATVTAKSAKGTATLSVTVEVEPLPAYASGSFQGLLPGATNGVATLTVSSSGVPSLKIEAGGRTQTLKGVWLDAFTVRFTTKAGAAIDVALTEAGASFTGLDVEARQVLTDKNAIAPYVGYYTGILAASNAVSGALDNRPGGYGYLTFSAAKTGSVKYAGKLADGTGVSGAARLTRGGASGTAVIPLYKPLYSKRGEVAAYAVFATNGAVSLNGEWVYPGKSAKLPDDAFAAAVSGNGAAYGKAVKAAALAAVYTNSVLVLAGSTNALEAVKGKLAAETGSGVKLSVTPGTGLFTGSFAGDDGKRYTFRGALVPALTNGAGYWLWPDASAAGYRMNRSFPVEVTGGGTP
jgi:hypothetical protein